MPDPGEDYQRWSTVADNNGDIDPLIDWKEGQARRTVNNSSRSLMAAHAKNRTLLNGSIVTTGLPNAQAFLSGVNYATIPTGLIVKLKVGAGLDNDGVVTLSMDGVDPIVVKKPDLTDTTGGEFKSDRFVDLIYNGTNWIYLYSAGNFAPTEDPVFDGDPQAPTPPDDDDDNSIATTEWVRNLIEGGEGIIKGQQVFATPGTLRIPRRRGPRRSPLNASAAAVAVVGRGRLESSPPTMPAAVAVAAAIAASMRPERKSAPRSASR